MNRQNHRAAFLPSDARRTRLAAGALALLLVAGPPAPAIAAELDGAADASPAGPGVPAGTAREAAPASAPTGLEGRSWQLAAYLSDGSLVEPATEGQPARLRFEDGRVTGSAGCNRLVGGYTLEGGSLKLDPPMASTMMACPEPLMAQEQAVGAALTQVAGYRIDGRLLELRDAEGRPLLRFVPVEVPPLVGPEWGLVSYNNGRQAIVSVLEGTEITLELRDDATLGGSDGCNRYMSGYTLEKAGDGAAGSALTIGPLATTRMACRGPEGAAEQARLYAQALGTVAGYRLEGDELTLLTAEGRPAARFRPSVPAAAPVGPGDGAQPSAPAPAGPGGE